MLLVMGLLDGAPSLGLINGIPHGADYRITIEDELAVGIPGSAAAGLQFRGDPGTPCGCNISMDGRGAWMDNVSTEPL
ncbi:MAG: hypothetical protein ABFS09_07165 [Thermodesulfobacteriota bacterium]